MGETRENNVNTRDHSSRKYESIKSVLISCEDYVVGAHSNVFIQALGRGMFAFE